MRAAIAAAEENKAQRRRDAAKRAVATRARRYEERIQQIADVIRTGKGIGNTTHCVVCKKALTDTVSQERGIGPECWDRIPQTIEQRRRDDQTPTAGSAPERTAAYSVGAARCLATAGAAEPDPEAELRPGSASPAVGQVSA